MSETKRATPAQLRERRDAIVRMTRNGMSQRDIADELDISRSLVQKEQRALREQIAALPAMPRRRDAKAVSTVKQSGDVGVFGASFATAILPPPDHLHQWSRVNLDNEHWVGASPASLISMIINVSPEASRAVWDWLRLVNAGHEIIAYIPGTDTPDERAQERLNEFLGKLNQYHGTFKAIAGRLFMNAITRGAFFLELVLDETGRVPMDIATPDPASIRFKSVIIEERGRVWVPGQWQGGKFVLLDSPTVQYVPLDPESDSPYGRPMVNPAIFPTVFLFGVLHDLRRVISQQGYPRTDVVIRLEQLRNAYAALSDDDFAEKVDELIAEVKREVASLEPDDTFVHTDPVELTRASGAVDSSVMQGSSAIIEVLERMATRALKSMPILMGSAESMSDANANRQWEIHAAGVRTLQHYAEAVLGNQLSLALQVQGIAADVRVRFAEIRAAEELRDAQTFLAKLRAAELAEQLGYMTPDMAAESATGHGIPAELRDSRIPLLNTVAHGAGDVSTATQLDGNEHEGADLRAPYNRARPRREIARVDANRVNAAVQTWRNIFRGQAAERMLDATVLRYDDDGGDDG